ncbi:Pyroglutamyl-peptidase 1 [Echria macrotheca]|uniref:Pyroglutamyl-peptidase 1 n=1 Tax=Echria macrotheca TaxID=438768 RepID=A0AAJ0BB62_9PEZI|nr:Pyroglutamyl-peptidase 1 [Echria macrotheca]
MGSTWRDTDTSQEEEVTVLITGFGPFKSDYPLNPSWEIARSLPAYLPPLDKKDGSKKTPKEKGEEPNKNIKLPPVRLLVHPEPIRVNYQTVRSLVPELWHLDDNSNSNSGDGDGRAKRKIDIAIHMGMAGPQAVYKIERRGHRDGYAMKDVDGEFLRDQERRAREGRGWVWYGMPGELETDLDLDDVLGRWRGYANPDHNIRISEDAGRYLCDFIYFSSLAHLTKANAPRNVVFFHVPCENSEKNYAVGRELVLHLVRAIVESELARRARFKGNGKK